jgi:amino-acid N-acetyltransferase
LLALRGLPSRFSHGLRVTDPATMAVAMEAAGKVQLMVSAALSKGPPLPALRRHGEVRHGGAPALRVACGNFVAAKRRGVVRGVDYGETGDVRHVDDVALRARLEAGDVALLSNLGYSAAGELLNCATWEVAAHAAAALQADKLIMFSKAGGACHDALAPSTGSRWMPLPEAEAALVAAAAGVSPEGMAQLPALSPTADLVPDPPAVVASALAWWAAGAPLELAAAVAVCRSGVERCHVLDAAVGGALLLELYTHDGVGTMVSRDRYEGTRLATASDARAVAALLAPLEADGTLLKRDAGSLLRDLGAGRFTVVERDGRVVASAALVTFPDDSAAEVAAFAVDAAYRGAGRGDALLEYVEERARAAGARRLFLLTTRAADWFQQRGFEPAGRAAGNVALPVGRPVDASRNSLLFIKQLGEVDPSFGSGSGRGNVA